DELHLKKTIDIPTLFVCGTQDGVLRPEMSENMENFFGSLTRREVVAAHWVLIQKPEELNAHLKGWLDGVAFGSKSKL
ncbi:hypothetical protein LTS18_010077, partial [Coniosporium uncinatum]